jgi:tetratricopeptide (TPR) repeat protein
MSMNAITPETPSQRYETLIGRLVGGRDWERALKVARDWLAEEPESVAAHLAAGQALVNLRRYAEARPHLVKTLTGNPRHDFAHRLASICCFHLNDIPKADEHIQQALTLQPTDAMHWYHLAWMRYQLGALDLAAKHARRSLELQPRDADTLNLLALCECRDNKAQLAQYLLALEIDPENSIVHNNLGTHYLNVVRDYQAAEESFRRALTLNPSNKTAQTNLFEVLKRRDPIYRTLSLPWTLVGWASLMRKDRTALGKIGLVALWLFAGRFFVAILLFWFALIYPLLKVYEYLTLGDIQAKAGVLGARRGGFLGYRRWPLAVRFGIFVALTVLFWGGVYVGFAMHLIEEGAIVGLLALPLLFVFVAALIRSAERSHRRRIAKRSEKKMNRQMKSSAR